MLSVSDVQSLIAAALTEERATVIPVIRQALQRTVSTRSAKASTNPKLLEHTRGLELAIAKLESALAQLQLTLASERSGKLPPNFVSVN
jgi:hypothetical protein